MLVNVPSLSVRELVTHLADMFLSGCYSMLATGVSVYVGVTRESKAQGRRPNFTRLPRSSGPVSASFPVTSFCELVTCRWPRRKGGKALMAEKNVLDVFDHIPKLLSQLVLHLGL